MLFVLILIPIILGQTTDSPTITDTITTHTTTTTTTTQPIYTQLGFIVGMSIMGGLILMVSLFMIITACQRAHKRRAKKPSPKVNTTPNTPNTPPNTTNTNLQDGETVLDMNETKETEKIIGGDSGPF